MLEGPRLGHFYDFLLRHRPAPPVSGEILLIDSSFPGQEFGEDILEPGAASSLLYTMAELGTETLIIQVPILGLSAGRSAGEAEILYRFDEEFSLLSRNIRNLFEAIKTGSVAPAESARYVGELVELSGKGKERLVSALVRRDEEGIKSMEKAAAFFGHVRRPGDLRVQLIRAGEGGQPAFLAERDEYSRAMPDRDGALRRVIPVMKAVELSDGRAAEKTAEHIIYGALKTRYANSAITYTDASGLYSGQVLTARDSRNGKDIVIPLDRNGAVLFELPRGGEGFRHIGISEFLAYDEADRGLRRLIAEGETLGIFQGVEGENQPGFLYDYALSLREEFAQAANGGTEANRLSWIDARNSYFSNLENFLYGPSEMRLVDGYEKIIASESLGETEISKMTEMRDALIRAFAGLREKHKEVLELRNRLESALSGSFCILGRVSKEPPRTQESFFSLIAGFPQSIIRSTRGAFYRANPTDAEASALLANSLLTGRAIKPGNKRCLLAGSLFCSLLICLMIKTLGPAATLGAGVLLTLLAGMGFSVGFILSGLWLDPAAPVTAGCASVLISFIYVLAAGRRYTRRFHLAYGPFVSQPCLRSVIRAGKPLPSQTVTANAAVAAIRKSDPADPENASVSNIQTVLAFHNKAAELFKKAGGTIIGLDGDTVSACFGSPLERVFLNSKRENSPYEDNIYALSAPALRAVDFVSEIARRAECANWYFGLDMGDCVFAWSALSGYFALGNSVRKARILSQAAVRYKSRIVVSEAINETLPAPALKKLDSFKSKGDAGEEPFFELPAGT
jgi:class 3 adenylate cyclase